MSIRAMSLVWDTDLPSTEKFLLLALADWAAHDGSSIFPSQHRMACKIGVTDRAIRTLLERLKTRGVLVEIEPYNSRAPAQYRINMAALSALTQPDPDDTDRNDVPVEPGSSLPPPERNQVPQGGTRFLPPPPPRVERRSTNPSVVEAVEAVESREAVETTPHHVRIRIATRQSVNGSGSSWPSPEALVKLFNLSAPPGHPQVTTLTIGRRRKAEKYLRQFPDEEFWRAAFAETRRSRFLRGLKPSPGHEGFKATFDWLLTKGKDGTENIIKVSEGQYRDRDETAGRDFHV